MITFPPVSHTETILIPGRGRVACAVLRVAGLGGVRVAVVREEHELVRRTDRIFVRSCRGSEHDPGNLVATDANGPTNGEKSLG